MTDTAQIIPFDTSFDGTDMPIAEIQRQVRERGWAGLRIDADEWAATGKLIVRRMSRKEVEL